MKRITLLALLFLSISLSAQDLLNSRQTSYYSYIFKISEHEAKSVYKSGYRKVEPEFFHTLVDSFPTDEEYKGKLPAGHFLKVHSQKDRLVFSITTVQDYDVMIADNSTDMLVKVYDLEGQIVKDAKIHVRGKKLYYDTKTRSYCDRKSNQKGLMKVEYKGFTTYYNLNRKYNNSAFKRNYTRIIYGKPVRYVWMPIRYVVRLPIDGARSIIRGYASGVIWSTWNFMRRIFDYDQYQCNGYMITNKPKYMPGDTVKVKAFLLDKHFKALDGDVEAAIYKYPDPVIFEKVSPYRNGGYAFEFVLHDSFDLRLDQIYNISLSKGRYSKSVSFRYEDYELGNLQLQVDLDDETQYRGKPFSVKVKGTDQNDLNILDGELEVFISPVNVSKFFDTYTFIPDTLLYREMHLSPEGETEITIPDSIFPEANLEYQLEVRLITSDNETLSETKNVIYYHELKAIEHRLIQDSILFTYEENGKEKSTEASVFGLDNFGNNTLLDECVLPLKVKIVPYYKTYRVKADSIEYNVDLSSEPALLQCFTSRDRDSIQLQVQNPRDLDFSYYIYRKNVEKDRGYTDSLNAVIETGTERNYYVALQYLWGGSIQHDNYEIPLHDKKLYVKVIEPVLVYPSQTSEIEVQVTDIDAMPVPDVDLTAYSMTSKFDYSAPTLSYMGKSRKKKSVINSFDFRDFDLSFNPGIKLDYEEWKLFAGLDSIEYYKFIYPGNSIYRNEFKTPDRITQFSPFVFVNGTQVPVHVIYVDNVPVYFSWVTNRRPYAFHVPPGGPHRVRIRTRNAEYSLSNVRFRQGYKTILSIPHNIVNENVVRKEMPPRITRPEKALLDRYVMTYRNTFGNKYAYIKQGDKVFDMRKDGWKKGYSLGPVKPASTEFNLIGEFQTDFQFEPGYSYEFRNGLLKMRSEKKSDLLPKYFPYIGEKGMDEEVETEQKILDEWQDYLDRKRIATKRYYYNSGTVKGNGSLNAELQYSSDIRPMVLNTLLFKTDNSAFLRVYNGSCYTFMDLEPGFYKVVYFYKNAEYFVADSLYVNGDGTNYHRITFPEMLSRDDFSREVSKLIQEYIFKPNYSRYQEEAEIRNIYNSYVVEHTYTGPGKIIEGYVVAESDGLPIPGVSVVVKGTTIGTLTNLDGYYSIKVPDNRVELDFSFIGMESKTLLLGTADTYRVSLEESTLALEEVVVVGYGVMKSEACMSVVTAVNSQGQIMPGYEGGLSSALQGKVAGVSIIQNSGNAGSATTIKIRGTSSIDFDKSPLYVIDGQIFTGDIKELSSDMIQEIEILKDASATSIYGARGANGVVIISTNGAFKSTASITTSGAEYDDTFFDAALQSSSIRENFSDFAFWKPELRTDSEGKVRFKVTFPDDITSWDTYYLAMNGKRQAGQSEGRIKSYKPMMAQLAVPRFLVEGDSTVAIGKVLNYTPDSLSVNRKFELAGELMFEKNADISKVAIDSLSFTAPAGDSVSLMYSMHLEDGYFDGEKRDIPVFPVGLEETSGEFLTLDRDTTVTISHEDYSGEVQIYAKNDELGMLELEISKQIHYLYECNEQLASKLKALLSERSIAEIQGKSFGKTLQVNKVIRLLLRNKRKEEMWGWWKDSEDESLWISVHVMEALLEAKHAGYRVNVDIHQIKQRLAWYLVSDLLFDQTIRVLNLLHLMEPEIFYSEHVAKLERKDSLSLNQWLRFTELKQKLGMEYDMDTLRYFCDSTMFGNIYYSDRQMRKSLWSNDIQNTLLAYRILRNDTLHSHEDELRKIRNYLFEKRGCNGWTNTFESANIIETILPDVLGNSEKVKPAKIEFSGGIEKTVTSFPFDTTIKISEEIQLKKAGDSPVYFTMFQRYWNPEPLEKSGDFKIHTSFENDEKTNLLEAGEPVTLKVKLLVKKHADYVMLNIPIPAGCSYGDKKQHWYPEVHREYYRHETAIFCEKLRKGEYEFEIELLPRYSGKYTLNPAKVELMYFPTFNANTKLKKVEIYSK